MTAATPTTRGKAKATPSAIVPATLSHEDLMALLGAHGAVAQPQNDFHRMKLDGGVLVTDDGELFPPQKNAPSVRLRIVKPPVYYNAIFLTDKGTDGFNAAQIGRGDLNGRFTRKYDDPNEQAADTNPANEVYDQVSAALGGRGQFKGDLLVQIVPPSGEMTGDETVYTLSLSTTSIFEWRGSARNPEGGTVSDKNFMVRLGEFAINAAVEAGVEADQIPRHVVDALTSLRLGGVVADVYILRASNPDNGQSWPVLSFVPVYVEPPDGAPALTAGDTDVPI